MAQGARVMPRVVSRSDLLKIGLFSVIEVDTNDDALLSATREGAIFP